MASLVFASLGTTAAWAQADEYAEVNRLLRAGQFNQAMGKVDQSLATNPRDPQMRFLKGVIQTESGKPADAITTFTQLIEEFPELPEPYNNLAVLYAGQSQFDKARVALEMAIRINPNYATAHENLGDVYAKLASQAYNKALQLDSTSSGISLKLNLIRNLFNVTSGAAAATSGAPAARAAPATAATPATAGLPASDQAQVQAAVTAWANAWSTQNMETYLAAYAPSFIPPGAQSRGDWMADRKASIAQRSRIVIDVKDMLIDVRGDRATARFQQAFSSNSLNTSSRKTLDFVRSGGRWLIVRESTGT